MKIAVIGSGISGLSAAFYLSKKYKVDIFEQDNHFGGHSYTYDIKDQNETIPVDLGFIVFNELTYPNLINFFDELNVPFEKSNMSFSVSVQDRNIEYGGSGLKAIFADKFNLCAFPMTAFLLTPPIISAIWFAVWPFPQRSFNLVTFSSVQLILLYLV